ncbi:MAG: hypothetical protein ACR2QV_05540 [Gammaproteobacteria bacterium]
MRLRTEVLGFAAVLMTLPFAAQATSVQVDDGQTSVVFGFGALESIGLQITGIDGATIAPGSLGPNSVAFPIAAATTFVYEPGTLAPFAGAIEHAGGVSFTDIASGTVDLTLGDFTIGYDANRIGGANPDATGFFVQDNIDTGAILFDITNPIIEAFENSLIIAADIAISEELSDFLNSQGLVSQDVTGVDAGAALVVANSSIIPVPAAVWLFGSALALLGWARRKP